MLARIVCWILGHSDMTRFSQNRMYLECLECGRKTTGLTIDAMGR